jgi:hypothetical protein
LQRKEEIFSIYWGQLGTDQKLVIVIFQIKFNEEGSQSIVQPFKGSGVGFTPSHQVGYFVSHLGIQIFHNICKP